MSVTYRGKITNLLVLVLVLVLVHLQEEITSLFRRLHYSDLDIQMDLKTHAYVLSCIVGYVRVNSRDILPAALLGPGS